MAKEYTDNSFDINNTKVLTVLDFWAEWCAPCRALNPVIEQLTKEFPSVDIAKVNVDLNPSLSSQFGITSIPTLVFIKDGEVVDKQLGAQTKTKLADRINKLL